MPKQKRSRSHRPRLPGRARSIFLRSVIISIFTVSWAFAQTSQDASYPASITSVYPLHHLSENDPDPEGLSGLAWDADENLLYAVSDLGMLYHFEITLSDNMISSVNLISRYPLLDTRGSPLKGKYDDAEGLESINSNNGIRGDSQLLVAFERKPRVSTFDTRGNWLTDVPIGPELESPDSWRKPNSSLESVTLHPGFGVLVGLEKPVTRISEGEPETHSIHAIQNDRIWKFHTGAIGKSALTAISVVNEDQLVVLEREFQKDEESEDGGTYYAALTHLNLDECETGICQGKLLGVFQGNDLLAMGNFEGLAIYDHIHFLMVSDNGGNIDYPSLLALITLTNDSM